MNGVISLEGNILWTMCLIIACKQRVASELADHMNQVYCNWERWGGEMAAFQPWSRTCLHSSVSRKGTSKQKHLNPRVIAKR